MDESKVKIRFYNIDGSTNDSFLVRKDDFTESTQDLKQTNDFNTALKKVVKKDINLLSINLKNIISEITKKLLENGTMINDRLKGGIKDIDKIIEEIEVLSSELIIERNSIKTGFFSSRKKEKKERQSDLDNSIEYLSKVQNKIIAIKNEYDKLKERNKTLESFIFEKEESLKEETDPLARTINFYMKKK